MRAAGLRARDLLLLDDLPENILAAAAQGVAGVRLRRGLTFAQLDEGVALWRSARAAEGEGEGPAEGAAEAAAAARARVRAQAQARGRGRAGGGGQSDTDSESEDGER
jgi:hypothetical protein